MPRKTFDEITAEIEAAKAAGTIWNVDFNDLNDAAGRLWEDAVKALSPRQTDKYAEIEWMNIPEAVRKAYDNVSLLGLYHVATRKPYQPKFLSPEIEAEAQVYNAVLERFRPISQGLRDLKPLIKKGRKVIPVTPEKLAEIRADAEARRTCQICGRPILPTDDGKIHHHGYERPGDGQQTASCYGALEDKFERSRDALGRYIAEVITVMIADAEQSLTFWMNHVGDLWIERSRYGDIITTTPPDPRFPEIKARHYPAGKPETVRIVKGQVINAEAKLKALRQYKVDQQKRFDGWIKTED